MFLLVALLLSNWPPLKFWDKSAAIFGYKFEKFSVNFERSFGGCIIAQIAMVCPKGDSKGLVYAGLDKVSTYDLVLALLLSETNLLLSVASTKLYRKMKNLSLTISMIWNVVIYLIFTLFTYYLIIKLRLMTLYEDED